MRTTESTASEHFIRGLDSIRFVAALIVAGSHDAWPRYQTLFQRDPHGAEQALAGIWNMSTNGLVAVCAFFFISGFCIHYPNLLRERVAPAPFMVKRMVRIGLPLLAAIALARIGPPEYLRSLDSILWSIYCELAYYFLYPFLFPLLLRRPRTVVAVSCAVSVAILAFNLHTPLAMFGSFPFILFAPIWLLGALLAAQYRSGALFVLRLPSIWLFRALFLGFSILLNVLAFHSPIRIEQPIGIALFVPFGYFWLAKELQRTRAVAPWQWLERLGLASYSLYLTHKLTLTWAAGHLPAGNPWLYYALQAGCIAALAAGFYFLIEAPSHRLAKTLGARVSGRSERAA